MVLGSHKSGEMTPVIKFADDTSFRLLVRVNRQQSPTSTVQKQRRFCAWKDVVATTFIFHHIVVTMSTAWSCQHGHAWSLTATDHVNTAGWTRVFTAAVCTARDHGLLSSAVNDHFRSTLLAKMLYFAPVWTSFCASTDCTRLDTLLRSCKKLRYCDDNDSLVRRSWWLAVQAYLLHHYIPQWSRPTAEGVISESRTT